MSGRELQDILDALRSAPNQATAATPRNVLATLVCVRGSTYRRPGARMLVRDGHRVAGTISGGCLEAEVCRQAKLLGSSTRLIEFNTIDDDDALIGYSMGCKGIIRILLQPLAGDAMQLWEQIARSRDAGQPCCLATVYAGPRIGQQALLADERLFGAPEILETLAPVLRSVMQRGKRRNLEQSFPDGLAEVFVEPIAPPVRLLIFGGGPDAAPLAQIAHALGWHVVVVDPRPRDLLAGRFPHARQIIESAPIAALSQLKLTARTAVVLMMHNYALDADLLEALPPAAAAYIGLLGPRHRTRQIADDLGRRGIDLNRKFANLYTPAGLDLGTDDPEEIALAIVAEIQAVMSHRGGGHLRDRDGDIHDPPEDQP